jgi:hypothetical protein
VKLVKLTQSQRISAAYYDLVQQQQLRHRTTIVISNQRLTLAQKQFTIGKASKLEVLMLVDLKLDGRIIKTKKVYL